MTFQMLFQFATVRFALKLNKLKYKYIKVLVEEMFYFQNVVKINILCNAFSFKTLYRRNFVALTDICHIVQEFTVSWANLLKFIMEIYISKICFKNKTN